MPLRSEVEVHCATFGVEARGNGNALDQCRLPTAVLAHKDRRARIEHKRADSLKCREAQRVRPPLKVRSGDFDAADEGLRQGRLWHHRSIRFQTDRPAVHRSISLEMAEKRGIRV